MHSPGHKKKVGTETVLFRFLRFNEVDRRWERLLVNATDISAQVTT